MFTFPSASGVTVPASAVLAPVQYQCFATFPHSVVGERERQEEGVQGQGRAEEGGLSVTLYFVLVYFIQIKSLMEKQLWETKNLDNAYLARYKWHVKASNF